MKTFHILVVDDLKTTQLLLPVHLVGSFYEFESADNGREGLEIARSMHPDLIITDINMPDMGGVELCQKVRADPALRDIPVILMTATVDKSEAEKLAQKAGANAVLTKPLDTEILAATVKRLLPTEDGEAEPD